MNAVDEAITRNADDNILAVLEPEIENLVDGTKEAGFTIEEIIQTLEAVVQKIKIGMANKPSSEESDG